MLLSTYLNIFKLHESEKQSFLPNIWHDSLAWTVPTIDTSWLTNQTFDIFPFKLFSNFARGSDCGCVVWYQCCRRESCKFLYLCYHPLTDWVATSHGTTRISPPNVLRPGRWRPKRSSWTTAVYWPNHYLYAVSLVSGNHQRLGTSICDWHDAWLLLQL